MVVVDISSWAPFFFSRNLLFLSLLSRNLAKLETTIVGWQQYTFYSSAFVRWCTFSAFKKRNKKELQQYFSGLMYFLERLFKDFVFSVIRNPTVLDTKQWKWKETETSRPYNQILSPKRKKCQSCVQVCCLLAEIRLAQIHSKHRQHKNNDKVVAADDKPKDLVSRKLTWERLVAQR